MARDCDVPPDGYGLVALGSSHGWDVAVDESLDREDEWNIEIEGPQVYIVFQLGDPGVLRRALEFLRCRRRGPVQAASHRDRGDDDLVLGRFGASSVSLIWDDEDFARCFLVVGPQARSTMRVSLYGEDIDQLIQALEQAVEGIPSKD
jgi:hypothetical protein